MQTFHYCSNCSIAHIVDQSQIQKHDLQEPKCGFCGCDLLDSGIALDPKYANMPIKALPSNFDILRQQLSLEVTEEVDYACHCLESLGLQFAVDFGTDNACEKLDSMVRSGKCQ